MSSRSTMFWPSRESKGDLTPDSRILSVQKPSKHSLTVPGGRQLMHHVLNASVTIPCAQESM